MLYSHQDMIICKNNNKAWQTEHVFKLEPSEKMRMIV